MILPLLQQKGMDVSNPSHIRLRDVSSSQYSRRVGKVFQVPHPLSLSLISSLVPLPLLSLPLPLISKGLITSNAGFTYSQESNVVRVLKTCGGSDPHRTGTPPKPGEGYLLFRTGTSFFFWVFSGLFSGFFPRFFLGFFLGFFPGFLLDFFSRFFFNCYVTAIQTHHF